MGTFEEFEHYLSEALAYLYDPSYQPPELIWEVTGCDPQQGVESVQAVLRQAIEALKPEADVPKTARANRFYKLLTYRYIHELTQVNTAVRLSLNPRHVRREQQQAIRVLARRLWEQRPVETPATIRPDDTSETWYSQIRQELTSLQQSNPEAVAEVGAAINSAVNSANTLAAKHNVSLRGELVQQKLMATIHPSVLREILITTIEKLVQHMSAGEITFQAELEEHTVKITMSGAPTKARRLPHSDFIQEVLAMQGGSVESQMVDDRLDFLVTLPSADKIIVLVIDDNADLVHFYRHHVAQTRYQIVHVAEGQHVFETIANTPPDIIVLDIMLPDIDGWELLTRLHEHPDTRLCPIIVCSVVRREELALAHGAALYLQKPVRRQQFIQALDQAYGQVSTRAPRT
jgi:CheY-like chemotaxis protein